MVPHDAKVDKCKEDDGKADEDATGSERLERECHRPAGDEPIGENNREPNSMDYRFLEIGTRRSGGAWWLGIGAYFCLFFPEVSRNTQAT